MRIKNSLFRTEIERTSIVKYCVVDGCYITEIPMVSNPPPYSAYIANMYNTSKRIRLWIFARSNFLTMLIPHGFTLQNSILLCYLSCSLVADFYYIRFVN